MKKERFFRLLGDLDDHILDKYREMDPDEGIPDEDGDEDFDLRAFDGDEE